MTGPFMPTLAGLFALAAAGYSVSALPNAPALGSELARLQHVRQGTSPKTPAHVTADGILIAQERQTPATSNSGEEREEMAFAPAPVPAPVAALTAERIELRQAARKLETERRELEAAEARRDAARAEERRHLAAIYTQMPPKKAATVLAALSSEQAAAFLTEMPGPAGAAVLAEMPDQAAVEVTRAMIEMTP